MQKWDKKTAFNLINWLLKGTIAAVLMFTIYKQAFAEERLSLFFEAVTAGHG